MRTLLSRTMPFILLTGSSLTLVVTGHAEEDEPGLPTRSGPEATEASHSNPGQVHEPNSTPSATPEEESEASRIVAMCVEEHESSQLLRREGKLLEARASLLACSNSICPLAVRRDCSGWYAETDAVIPSIVLSARRNESDLFVADVFIDGALVTTELDGRELRLNPGRHTIAVELAGGQRQEREILVAKGEKTRRVPFDFLDPSAGAPLEDFGIDTQDTPTRRPVTAWTYALGATSLVGFSLGTAFGLSAVSQRREARETCAPYCSMEEKARIDDKILVADLAFGVGVVSALAAVVTYVARPRVTDKPSSVAQTSGAAAPALPSFEFAFSARRGQLAVGGQF